MAIKPTKKAYTFRLQAVDSDPDRAAAIVDASARALADFLKSEQVEIARQEKASIEGRLEKNQQEVDDARQILDQFKRENRLASLSEELTLQLRAIANLEEELARTQNELPRDSEEAGRNAFTTGRAGAVREVCRDDHRESRRPGNEA